MDEEEFNKNGASIEDMEVVFDHFTIPVTSLGIAFIEQNMSIKRLEPFTVSLRIIIFTL